MADEAVAYLALMPRDIERWQNSRAYRRMSLAAQGAYQNLWDAAWKAQPSCELADDDRELWRLANASSIEEWQAVKAEVFMSDAWAMTERGTWLHEVVLEVYEESRQRHGAAILAGRIAGKASGRARRAKAQAKAASQLGTTVERPLNDRRTKSNPPSLSLSPSPSQTTNERTTDPGPAAPGPAPLAVVRASPKRSKPADPWPTAEAIDDYRERYGAGSGKPPQIIGGINPLVRGNAQELQVDAAVAWANPVRPAWRRYLGLGPGPGTTHPAPSAQDFAAHFADWLPAGRGPSNGGGRESVVDLYQGGLELLEKARDRDRSSPALDADGHARPRITSGR